MTDFPADSLLSTQFETFRITDSKNQAGRSKGLKKLTLSGKEFNTVYFQDRPLRGYGHFEFDEITGKKAWRQLFGNDNPNSILSGNGHSAVFKTYSFKAKKDGSYVAKIKPLSDRQDFITGVWENSSLLIDPTASSNSNLYGTVGGVAVIAFGAPLLKKLLIKRAADAAAEGGDVDASLIERWRLLADEPSSYMIDEDEAGYLPGEFMDNYAPYVWAEFKNSVGSVDETFQNYYETEAAKLKEVFGDSWDNVKSEYGDEFEVPEAEIYDPESTGAIEDFLDYQLDNLGEEYEVAWANAGSFFKSSQFQGEYSDLANNIEKAQFEEISEEEINGSLDFAADSLAAGDSFTIVAGDIGGESLLADFGEAALFLLL